MENYFSKLHPLTNLAVLLVVLIYLMLVGTTPWILCGFCALSLCTAWEKGVREYGALLGSRLVTVLFFALFNVIFNHAGETPFLYVNDMPLTVEALTYGTWVGVMVVSLFLWFDLFHGCMDNGKITWLLGSRFPTCALVLTMIFCYREKFRYKILRIRQVWDTYGTKERFGTVKNLGIVLSVLLSVMLEDSMDTALSMSARGYGSGKRTRYLTYVFTGEDGVILALLGIAMVLAWQGGAAFHVLFGACSLAPLIYNVYKELQWKYYLWRT